MKETKENNEKKWHDRCKTEFENSIKEIPAISAEEEELIKEHVRKNISALKKGKPDPSKKTLFNEAFKAALILAEKTDSNIYKVSDNLRGIIKLESDFFQISRLHDPSAKKIFFQLIELSDDFSITPVESYLIQITFIYDMQ